ncbi:MAG TPA: EVE domain-containing protein [Candidatus Binataceae bacterium]|nr:EVE domain-containing protein [Candidatus Binataceae bacterium]
MRYWIGVASRDHVMIGAAGGFCQLGHGKAAPIRRLSPGDWIVYYSPCISYPDGAPLQAFTALGEVLPGEPYTVAMSPGFVPTRRDLRFVASHEAPIKPLLERLSFIADQKSWGQIFRRGLVEISERDFRVIANAMGYAQNPPVASS